MNVTARRRRFREILEGDRCVHPASVFDPISARIAEDLGFEVGMFAGSIASATVLGAPDLIVLTLTEFAQQVHRICRAGDLSLMVDADHGYGNALSVKRYRRHATTPELRRPRRQLPDLPGGGRREDEGRAGRPSGPRTCDHRPYKRRAVCRGIGSHQTREGVRAGWSRRNLPGGPSRREASWRPYAPKSGCRCCSAAPARS